MTKQKLLQLQAQESFLRHLREASRIGITSRLTIFLMWKCENDSRKQIRMERGRVYPQLLTYKHLML